MKKLFFTIIFLTTFTGVAAAQDGTRAAVRLLFNTNQSAQDFNNVGLGGDLGYQYKNWYFGGAVNGSDNNPTRTAYIFRYNLPKWRGAQFAVGGGYHKFGNGLVDGGVVAASGTYGHYWAEAFAGDDETVSVRAGKAVWYKDNYSLGPVFNFEHRDLNGQNFNLYSVGLQLNFHSNK